MHGRRQVCMGRPTLPAALPVCLCVPCGGRNWAKAGFSCALTSLQSGRWSAWSFASCLFSINNNKTDNTITLPVCLCRALQNLATLSNMFGANNCSLLKLYAGGAAGGATAAAAAAALPPAAFQACRNACVPKGGAGAGDMQSSFQLFGRA